MGQAVADIFGIKFGFYGFLVNTKVKVDFDNMVEEINSVCLPRSALSGPVIDPISPRIRNTSKPGPRSA